MIRSLPEVYLIVGPTGAGKTAVSIPVAQALNAEIISADSRQIYREMNIVTAKPDSTELSAVPHHFIDVVNPDEIYNAGRFGEEGRQCAEAILHRGKKVLIVGGSGLYIRSLIDGFFEGAGKDESVRYEIRQEMAVSGVESMYRQLQEVDPEAATHIHPNDAKRIERALEVYRITAKPLSWHFRRQCKEPWCIPVFAGLTLPREWLYRRIEERIDRMLQQGALEETRTLLEKGYSLQSVAMEGLGYREIIAYFRGSINYETMVRLFKQRSRNYAKRQMTWFRKDSRIRWFPVNEYTDYSHLAEAIVAYFTGQNKK